MSKDKFLITVDGKLIDPTRVQVVHEWREKREYGEEVMWEPVSLERINKWLESAAKIIEIQESDITFWAGRAMRRSATLQEVTIALEELIDTIDVYLRPYRGKLTRKELRIALQEAGRYVEKAKEETGLA